ncbi:MAG: type II secretion system protein [Desulfobacterales bacterium]|jgi:prepilin-type N-terminal cleavage/methylation domain-containing protein
MMNDRGLTLIEIIVVMVLISIVTAVILTRTMDIPVVSTAASAASVKAHLRYAQTMAMKQNAYLWGIKCDGTDYWLFRTPKQENYATDPGDQNTALFLPGEDVDKVPASGMSAFTLYFDGYGRPRQYVSADGDTAPITSVLTITLEGGSLQVSPETGFVS